MRRSRNNKRKKTQHLQGVPQLPAAAYRQLGQGIEPDPESEAAADQAIRLARLEIRRRHLLAIGIQFTEADLGEVF